MLRIARYLFPGNRISLSHTCRHVRDILLSDFTLWSPIAAHGVPAEGLDTLLRRSGSLPRLRLHVDKENASAYRAVLETHLHALRELDIVLLQFSWDFAGRYAGHVDISTPDWLRLSTSLSMAAPMLEVLVINNTIEDHWTLSPGNIDLWRPQSWDWVLPHDLLAEEPGRLRKCTIHGLRLPRSIPSALFRLTRFGYGAAVPLTSTVLDTILRSLPDLQILGLAFRRFEDDGAEPPDFTHHSLSKVTIQNVTAENARLLAYFFRPKIRQLFIWYMHIDLPELTHVAEASLSSSIVALRYADGLQPRDFYTTYLPSLSSPQQRVVMFSNVTVLNIGETMWEVLAPLPSFPCLVTLRIFLADCAEWSRFGPRDYGEPSSLFACDEQAALSCPVLRVLEFSSTQTSTPCLHSYDPGTSPSCSEILTVSLHDIVSFIRSRLRFGPSKLRALRLHGLACVDVDPCPALVAVLDIATSFDMSPTAAAHPGSMARAPVLPAQITEVFDVMEGEDYMGQSFALHPSTLTHFSDKFEFIYRD